VSNRGNNDSLSKKLLWPLAIAVIAGFIVLIFEYRSGFFKPPESLKQVVAVVTDTPTPAPPTDTSVPPTDTPTPEPPTGTPVPEPTGTPTPAPSDTPTSTSTSEPINTSTPTPEPTNTAPPPTDTPTSIPTPTLKPTATPLPPTPTPVSGSIPFGAPDDPLSLNPILGWQPGASIASRYDLGLDPGALTLIAGPNTDQWKLVDTAPMILLAARGDLEAQVKVVFGPERNYEFVGLGVRSAEDNTTWVRLGRGYYNGQSVGFTMMQRGKVLRDGVSPYSNDTVYFKIERRASLFALSYSVDGNNWVFLTKDSVIEVTDEVQIYLYAFSSERNDLGVVARFYDFAVIQN